MSKKKAEEFVDYLAKHPDLVEKMKGFTHEEFKDALTKKIKSGDIKEEKELNPHNGI
ncbi:MAG: hypothetical protein PVH61_33270 [Candidatus Aminicenantes bacterium]|jgi:hypothetical protein